MLEEGSVFHGIKALRPIDAVTFTRVWQGIDTTTNCNVALRVVSKKSLSSREVLSTYRREHAIAKRIDHPFIVPVYFDFELTDAYVSVVEFVPGGSLRQFIAKQGPLEETLARRYFCELLVTVEYLHRGLKRVHGDLVSTRVMLDGNGHIRVGDWIRSRIVSLNCETGERDIPTAPEQLSTGDFSESADLWALGVILYEMVVGKEPFDGPPAEAVRKIFTVEPEYPATLSPLLVDFLKGILKKNAVMRFTIDDIKAHKWFSMTEYQTMSRLLDEHEVNKEIVEKMVTEVGIDCSNVVRELQAGQMTRNTCIYAEMKRMELVRIMSDVIAGKRVHAMRRKTEEMRKVRSQSKGQLDKYSDTEEDSTSASAPQPKSLKGAVPRAQPRKKMIRIAARKSARSSIGGRGMPPLPDGFD